MVGPRERAAGGAASAGRRSASSRRSRTSARSSARSARAHDVQLRVWGDAHVSSAPVARYGLIARIRATTARRCSTSSGRSRCSIRPRCTVARSRRSCRCSPSTRGSSSRSRCTAFGDSERTERGRRRVFCPRRRSPRRRRRPPRARARSGRRAAQRRGATRCAREPDRRRDRGRHSLFPDLAVDARRRALVRRDRWLLDDEYLDAQAARATRSGLEGSCCASTSRTRRRCALSAQICSSTGGSTSTLHCGAAGGSGAEQ